MYEQYHAYTEIVKTKDINLYEYLSKVINNLSTLLSLAHKILAYDYQDQHFLKEQTISEFTQIINNSEILDQCIELERAKIELSNIVNKRLINRVIEIILPFKQKALKYSYLRPLSGLVEQIENSISNFHENLYLQNLIRSFNKNFETFLSVIKALGRFQKFDLLSKAPFKQKQIPKEPFSASIKTESDSSKKFRKIIISLNSRFKTVSCLDIQYSHYRSSYFQIVNKEDYYTDYLKRNQQIKSQIMNYKKDFQDYTNRRQKRKIEKRFSFNNHSNEDRKTMRNFNLAKLPQKRFNTKIDEKSNSGQKEIPYQKRFSLSTYRDDEEYESKIALSPMKKTSIKMKSIIISVDRNKLEPMKEIVTKNYNPIKLSCEGYRKNIKKKNEKNLLKDLQSVRKNFKIQ